MFINIILYFKGWTHQILAMDCKGTNICRFGILCTTALPNSTRTLACLEKFYVEMKNVKVLPNFVCYYFINFFFYRALPFMKLQATLNSICNKANDIALSHARAHRLYRRKRKEEDRIENTEVEVGGCFGKVTGTPSTKKSRCLELSS